MGRRGPPPKPTALKVVCNIDHAHTSTCYSDRKAPNKNEPKPKKVVSLDPPDHICMESKRQWKKLVPQLIELGIVTEIDYQALVLMFEADHNMRAAWDRIEETGSFSYETEKGYECVYPEVSIWKQNAELKRKMLSEFGLTPAARSRIQVVMQTEEDAEKQAEDEYFFRTSNRRA